MRSTSHNVVQKINLRGGQWLLRSVWIHPLFIFLSTWLLTVALYELHLSLLLIYPSNLVIHVVAWIVVPYTLTILLYLGFHSWERPSPLSFRLDFRLQTVKLTK